MNQSVQILLKNSLAHIQAQELSQARDLLLKARDIDPLDSGPLRLMAVIAAMEYQFEDALVLIDLAIGLDPNNGVAHSNRGNILKELGQYEEALAALDTAIGLEPLYAEAYSNKGNILQELAKYSDAIAWFDKAIEIEPNYAEAYSNKGNALMLLGRFKAAVECFEQATTKNPSYIDAYWHQALTQLISGDYLAGFQNYEARWFKSKAPKLQYDEIPRLKNLENISGKRVLIWAEQGLGDTLQFCRYIKLLVDRGANVSFVIPQQLMRVLNSFHSYCTLIAVNEMINVDLFDFQLPLLSLPLIFGTTLQTIPADIPYLGTQVSADIKLKNALESNKFKVGLIWNGGFRPDSPELWVLNRRRNIELEQIANLKDVQDVDFYSLQKGDPAESELKARKDQLWPSLIDCAPLLEDFSDTAALMANLDLIISVDTSSAHLAGAIGKPVWILNRYDSCWRWLHNRNDSPWYPTAKIYQQKSPGDWEGVISRVKTDLTLIANKRD